MFTHIQHANVWDARRVVNAKPPPSVPNTGRISGGRCAFASEVDAAACGTYRLNWPQGGGDKGEGATAQEGGSELLERDILHLPADELPHCDLLTGGFPHQPGLLFCFGFRVRSALEP